MGITKRSVVPHRDSTAVAMSALRRAASVVTESYTLMEAIRDSPTGDKTAAQDQWLRAAGSGDAQLSVGNGGTPLHICAAYGRYEALTRQLSSHAADINVKDDNGHTALHLACRSGHARCVDLLIQAGADTAAVDASGCTALHLTVKYRHVNIAEALVKQCQESLKLTDSNLRTPLHDAVLTGSEQLCRLMIQRGASLNAKDAFGRTPMMLACSAGLVDLVTCLFNEHAACSASEPDPDTIVDNEGASAIHYAVTHNHLPLVKTLAKRSANISKAKKCGGTALHIAASKGYKEALEILIGAGTQVDAVDAGGATPLHRASGNNRLDCVDLLLRKGANAGVCDDEGKTPCHWAAAAGHADVLDRLLNRTDDTKAEPLMSDNCMRTPLHHACLAGRARCADVLIASAVALGQEILHSLLRAGDSTGCTAAHIAASLPEGASMLNAILHHAGDAALWTDAEMKTPLHCAAEHNCAQNIELLLTHRPDIAATDNEGRTALHLACMHGCAQAAAVLLAKGSDVDQREWSGRQPLMLAAEGSHDGVVRLLLKTDCEVNAVDGRGCTALHAACASDSAEVVRLLVDAGCDLSVRDRTGATALQTGIAGRCQNAAAAIINHDKWEIAMSSVDDEGFTPMQSLVENLPSVAKIVLDRCIRKRDASGVADADALTIYDYRYIDPHPDDRCCRQKKQWFVQSMAQQQQEELLFHPLTQNNITFKWARFGAFFHYIRFATFIIYLSLLTSYTFAAPGIAASQTLDVYGCSISNSTNSTLKEKYQQSGQDTSAYLVQSKDNVVILLQTLLLAISLIYLCQEVGAAVILRQTYLLKASSYVTLLMISTTIGFTCPPGFYPCLAQWRCGWIANLSVWASLMLFLGSIDFIGIYVIMFTAVTKSLLKLMLLLIVFFLGFSVVFNLLQNQQDVFSSVPNSLLSVFDMALGEINFSTTFLTATNIFAKESLWAVAIFMFIINIVLINLTIGVTIGDIEQMRASARFQMMAQKVEWLHQYETNFPIWLRRRLYVKENVKTKSSSTVTARSRVIAILKKFNDALAGPEQAVKLPQQDVQEDLRAELLHVQSQLSFLITVVEELKDSRQLYGDSSSDGQRPARSSSALTNRPR